MTSFQVLSEQLLNICYCQSRTSTICTPVPLSDDVPFTTILPVPTALHQFGSTNLTIGTTVSPDADDVPF